jgi:uncharacterized protein YeaO (DUF488 family)
VSIRLSEYSYGEKRRRGEGLRVGCTRYLVRGVKKQNYAKLNLMDVWLPTLAPSKKLLAWVKTKNMEYPKNWSAFRRRYRNEMKQTTPRQTIRTIAKLAKVTSISIGCYCNTDRCHRFELQRLIRDAAVGRF